MQVPLVFSSDPISIDSIRFCLGSPRTTLQRVAKQPLLARSPYEGGGQEPPSLLGVPAKPQSTPSPPQPHTRSIDRSMHWPLPIDYHETTADDADDPSRVDVTSHTESRRRHTRNDSTTPLTHPTTPHKPRHRRPSHSRHPESASHAEQGGGRAAGLGVALASSGPAWWWRL